MKSWYSICPFITITVFFMAVSCNYGVVCAISRNHYSCYEQFGYNALVIEPRETIYQNVNETINVFCISNPVFNISSDRMHFTRGLALNSFQGSTRIVNESTISLSIHEETPSKFQLFCQDSENNRCVRDVIIGYSPLNVKNFRCVSFSWKSLECSYDLAENPAQRVKDDYFLSYSSRGKSIFGFKCKNNQLEQCCNIGGEECWRWDNSEDFYYDVAEQYLEFTISSTNPLGNRSYTYIINQYEIMIPDEIKELKIQVEDATHISLFGRLPTFLNRFPPGITYRIKTEVCGHEEQTLTKIYGKKYFTKMIYAPWPGQTYKFSVSLRSGNNTRNTSDQDDKWWSRTVTQSIRTPSLPPKYAPRTTLGSFHLLNWETNLTTVTIFWEDLDQCLKGGQGFRYTIDVVDTDGSIDVQPAKITETYAIFENFITEDKNYTFFITPVNDAGRGEKTAEVKIAKRHQLLEDAFFPVVIYHSEEEILQLRWFTQEKQVEYILFWCPVDSNYEYDSEVFCKYISWKHILNQTETNITKGELGINQELELQKFRFGISTNKYYEGVNYSSGIVWSSCLGGNYDPESSMIAPLINVVSKTSSSLLITWELDCKSWRGFPFSIDILWCEGEDNLTFQCIVKNEVVDISLTSYELKNLKANQNYTIWVRIHFRYWESNLSLPLHVSTTNQVLSPAYIIFIAVLAAAVFVVVIIVMIFCPKKLMTSWRRAKQKLNLPAGITPMHNSDIRKYAKNSSSRSNENLNSVKRERKIETLPRVDPSIQSLLKTAPNSINNDISIREVSNVFSDHSEVHRKRSIDESKGETYLKNLNVGTAYDDVTYPQISQNYWHSSLRLGSVSHVGEALNVLKRSKSYSPLHIDDVSNSLRTAGYSQAISPTMFYQEPSRRSGIIMLKIDQRDEILNSNPLEYFTFKSETDKSYLVLPTNANNPPPAGYVQALLPTMSHQASSQEHDFAMPKIKLKDKKTSFNSLSNSNIALNELKRNWSYSVLSTNPNYSPLPSLNNQGKIPTLSHQIPSTGLYFTTPKVNQKNYIENKPHFQSTGYSLVPINLEEENKALISELQNYCKFEDDNRKQTPSNGYIKLFSVNSKNIVNGYVALPND